MPNIIKTTLLASLLTSFACNGIAQNEGSKDVDNFEKSIQSKQVQVLDVRTADEFKTGHLKGALQADWLQKQQFEDRTSYLDKNKPVYLYCLSGGRSAAAADALRKKGFKEVVNLEGGINAWKKAGKPLEEVSNIAQMTEDAYDKAIHSSPIVLVDFGAEWCPPCRKMKPVLEQFLKDHPEVKLLEVDAGIQTSLMKKFDVDALPDFILYKDGHQVWRKQGLQTQKQLVAGLKTAK